tara:strand:- start:18 stop:257 length:240 start_codon:yes stop_codon:yes gene_type:complete
MKNKIQKLIDEQVIPVLAEDGGSLSLSSVDLDGDNIIVNVKFQGACVGCPHAVTGTLMSIEKFLQQELSTENLIMKLEQ